MVTVNIRGTDFPLCLTVAALERLSIECGDLKGLPDYLNGGEEKNLCQSAYNAAYLLGILVEEGEEHRCMEERFSGGDSSRRKVPSPEDLTRLLNFQETRAYIPMIWAAIDESLHQDIAAEAPKNGTGGAEE